MRDFAASPQPADASPAQPTAPTTPAGGLRFAVLGLALPVLVEQILNTLVGLVDTYLAGQISTAATAAVGLAAYVGWFASLLVMLVGTGTTALVARLTGSGDHPEAAKVAGQSAALSALLGLLLLVGLYSLAPSFATAQRMTGETYAIAVEYLRTDAVGHVFLSILLVASAALRGAGNMKTPMAVFAVLNVTNVVVSLCLVYGAGPIPPLGVRGIVLGTVVAKAVGAILIILALFSGRAGIRPQLHHILPQRGRLVRILRIGVPAAADGAVMWGGHFTFLMIVALLADGHAGAACYAAHVVAIRVEAFTYLPAVAWGTAAATMVGQALGAQDRRRAIRAGHEAVLQCGALSLFIAVAFFVGAEWIYRVMQPTDPLVWMAGVPGFRVLSLLQPLLVVSIVYVHAMRGAGDTRFPLRLTILGILLVRLPLGWFFGLYMELGLMGAWMGMYGDMIYRATRATLHYIRADWAGTRV